ncbi:MAG: hypothetical protein A2W29_06790 [Gemmatimonadetes bacterium RBG_16_66_8]|nr:MAG: hypothetical protein A2W29_06790 [Gemmatimonadetes bacterium RBG_16_66_8]
MMVSEQPDRDYVSVADIEIDAVEPGHSGFRLRGLGADSAEYVLDLHLDMPLDQKTQTVLGELLSQSEWRVWRRVRQPLKPGYKSRTRPRTPAS